MRNNRYVWALVTLFILTLPLVNPATRGDGFFYLAHLRSAVVDHDLNYVDELAFANPKVRAYVVPRAAASGRVVNKFAIGSALLWAPYYIPVHCVSLSLEKAGYNVRADGFAPQYLWSVALATALYVFAGLLLTYNLLLNYFRPGSAFAATLALWFATSLPAYAYFHPTMSHGPSFFTVALFVFVWFKTRGSRSYMQTLALGAVAGVMMMVRTQNAVYLIVPVAEYLVSIVNYLRRRESRAAVAELAHIACLMIATGIFFSPQLAVWKILHGSIFRTGYENSFAWLQPKMLSVLFSTNHGVFLWTPVIAIAALGLIRFWRRDRLLAAAGAACFASQLYLIAAWGCWYQGSSFGGRMFIGTYPFLAFGLGAVTAFLAQRVKMATVWIFLVLLVLWNWNLLFQFGTGMIPREGPVPAALVVKNTLKVPARVYDFAGEYLFQRGKYRRYFFKAD